MRHAGSVPAPNTWIHLAFGCLAHKVVLLGESHNGRDGALAINLQYMYAFSSPNGNAAAMSVWCSELAKGRAIVLSTYLNGFTLNQDSYT